MTPTDDLTQTRPGGADPLDDPRVLAAVEEYAAALRAGERPDRDAFLARTPDIAAAVAECLDGLEFVCDAAPDLSGPAAPAADLQAAQPIGDFRIVREVGRGGMGVVYEAVQLSLGRRVALKVLPFAAAMDGRHLQRFRTEAQAAALLHHTNIVPVFAVGSDRGVHYYAMQFIDGQTLAQVIQWRAGSRERPEDGSAPATGTDLGALTRPRSPDTPTKPVAALSTERSDTPGTAFYRGAAELIAAVADALAYAHAQGVVHRDVKPANLLIDAHGTPWVTDFGLARLHADAGLTATGDLLGTLRYMSPEQASGHREPVDHRTDVYSLGVTLYELLTLRPAFDGSDRAELLRRIATEEPAPPRKFNPAVPADLETVVLKAMAKSPADRYETADALAADLRRFLEDRPILARRPTAVQRARKWARRHRGLVWATAAAAGVSLAGSFAFVWHAHHQALAAYRNEAGERLRAERERDRAERNLRMALDTLDQAFMGVAEQYFPVDKARSPAYRDLVKRALGVYQKLAEENRDLPKMRDEAARAYRRAGVIFMKVKELDEAEAPLRQSVELSRQAAADYPGDPRYAHSLGVCLYHLAQWCDAVRRKAEAEAILRESVAVREQLVADHPAEGLYRSTLAVSHAALGELLAVPGREADADAALRRSLEINPANAAVLNDRARLLATCPDPAVRRPAEAVGLAKSAVERAPKVAAYWQTLGVARLRSGDGPGAVAALERSVELGGGSGTVQDWLYLALSHARAGDAAAARTWYEKAVQRLAERPSDDPALARLRAEAAEHVGES